VTHHIEKKKFDEAQELQKCTFKPKVNQGGITERVTSRLHSSRGMSKEAKQLVSEMLEMKECTFNPNLKKTAKKNEQSKHANKEIFTTLYELGKEKQEKRDQ
jgi:hypothetical protein